LKYKGDTMRKMGKFEEAIEQYQMAIALKQDFY
jgi:tetratricopeptide (TPR) repeat protein